MDDRPIYVTEYDLLRLKQLIQDAQHPLHHKNEHLDQLQAELDRAHIVTPQAVPHDVITMNSRVRLIDLDTGEEETYTLVFPDNADIEHGRISVLAPVGTAILGYRVGDTFEWDVPAGKRHLRVKRILYQPEAAGDYHL
jgi:regulator of nucleoside diphosphate kinase